MVQVEFSAYALSIHVIQNNTKLRSSHFAKKFFFYGTTPLPAQAQYICNVYAKYQKASVKALVQIDFPVNALSKTKQANRKKMAVQKDIILSKSSFMASNVFMQMFNVSILCIQRIRLFQ